MKTLLCDSKGTLGEKLDTKQTLQIEWFFSRFTTNSLN